LGLRQDVVDLVRNGIALGFEFLRSKSQKSAKRSRESYQSDEGRKKRILCQEVNHLRLYQSSKSHKGQRHQAGGYHTHGCALERRRHIRHRQTFAHGGEKNQY